MLPDDHGSYLSELKRKPGETIYDWEKRTHELTCQLYLKSADATWEKVQRAVSKGEYHAARGWMRLWIEQTEEAERPFMPTVQQTPTVQ